MRYVQRRLLIFYYAAFDVALAAKRKMEALGARQPNCQIENFAAPSKT